MTLFLAFYLIPSLILLTMFIVGAYVNRHDGFDSVLGAMAMLFIPVLNIFVLLFVLDQIVYRAKSALRSK